MVQKDDKSPWYRGKFIEKFIIGETRQSWILGWNMSTRPDNGFKILKSKATRAIFDSEERPQ